MENEVSQGQVPPGQVPPSPPWHPRFSPVRSLILAVSLRTHLYLAFLIRLALIKYGEHQDSTMLVKFTDVDYRVFTDAARHVRHGESPFERHTYRYTPLLAWMLYPNVTLSPLFGKLLFCALDVFVGWMLYVNVSRSLGGHSLYSRLPQESEFQSRVAAFFWLYNPLVFVVSARGNAESVVVSLVLITLHLFRERVFLLSGIFYGLAVHFKIYPVIYAPALFFALTGGRGVRSLVAPNAATVRFVFGAAASFALFTGVSYHLYGDQFVEEAYLYHLGRRDTRHNFSPYFYMLYLTVEEDDVGITILAFLPQVILLLALAIRFGTPQDLQFCLFCQTVVFVAYNKVVTSQYFLWYLALLPLSLPRLRLSRWEALVSVVLWSVAQGFWLLYAYYLEFQGSGTFHIIWLESLAFFMTNVWLLSKFVRKYREMSLASDIKCDIDKVD